LGFCLPEVQWQVGAWVSVSIIKISSITFGVATSPPATNPRVHLLHITCPSDISSNTRKALAAGEGYNASPGLCRAFAGFVVMKEEIYRCSVPAPASIRLIL
jgi:hypothetical protein